MEIPNTWAPLMLSAVRDAVLYTESLLNSETIRDRSDYEEHHLQLTQFLEYLKSEYKSIEDEVGLPLDKIL
ncbi:hypothetical protein SAMN05660479_01803 [Microbulbifer thermotolerans]|uniref:Uncharacterized protein n=1 Tax=Microbulbifer thermotolerans TaxID=252514 RepID=A0A143HNZ0_MICTH|nr:hypothetical protein A3224_13390 [Microbulbifer thermotolerans]SFC50846.1 hypothetical protein SAMN05660479_01803 [Microbulbifer thermotolerans]